MRGTCSDFDFTEKGYEILRQIGTGQFGRALLVRCVEDNELRAAKIVDLSPLDITDAKLASQETSLLRRVQDNPYIVSLCDHFIYQSIYLVIIMEYCQGGDMAKCIRTMRWAGARFSETEVVLMLRQLLLGLECIHENHILHRDLKPSNILLTADGSLKIADFGVSRQLDCAHARTSIGTPQYMPPEMMMRRPYMYCSDMWSLGCVLYEMLTCKAAFDDAAPVQLAFRVCFTPPDALEGPWSDELRSIVHRLLRKEPEHRPKPAQLLTEAYLNGIPHPAVSSLGLVSAPMPGRLAMVYETQEDGSDLDKSEYEHAPGEPRLHKQPDLKVQEHTTRKGPDPDTSLPTTATKTGTGVGTEATNEAANEAWIEAATETGAAIEVPSQMSGRLEAQMGVSASSLRSEVSGMNGEILTFTDSGYRATNDETLARPEKVLLQAAAATDQVFLTPAESAAPHSIFGDSSAIFSTPGNSSESILPLESVESCTAFSAPAVSAEAHHQTSLTPDVTLTQPQAAPEALYSSNETAPKANPAIFHDRMAHDHMAHDHMAHDHMAHDHMAHDRIAHDRMAPDRAFVEEPQLSTSQAESLSLTRRLASCQADSEWPAGDQVTARTRMPHDQALRDRSMKEKPLKEKPLKEKPLKEKSLKEKPLKEKPLKDKSLRDNPRRERPRRPARVDRSPKTDTEQYADRRHLNRSVIATVDRLERSGSTRASPVRPLTVSSLGAVGASPPLTERAILQRKLSEDEDSPHTARPLTRPVAGPVAAVEEMVLCGELILYRIWRGLATHKLPCAAAILKAAGKWAVLNSMVENLTVAMCGGQEGSLELRGDFHQNILLDIIKANVRPIWESGWCAQSNPVVDGALDCAVRPEWLLTMSRSLGLGISQAEVALLIKIIASSLHTDEVVLRDFLPYVGPVGMLSYARHFTLHGDKATSETRDPSATQEAIVRETRRYVHGVVSASAAALLHGTPVYALSMMQSDGAERVPPDVFTDVLVRGGLVSAAMAHAICHLSAKDAAGNIDCLLTIQFLRSSHAELQAQDPTHPADLAAPSLLSEGPATQQSEEPGTEEPDTEELGTEEPDTEELGTEEPDSEADFAPETLSLKSHEAAAVEVSSLRGDEPHQLLHSFYEKALSIDQPSPFAIENDSVNWRAISHDESDLEHLSPQAAWCIQSCSHEAADSSPLLTALSDQSPLHIARLTTSPAELLAASDEMPVVPDLVPRVCELRRRLPLTRANTTDPHNLARFVTAPRRSSYISHRLSESTEDSALEDDRSVAFSPHLDPPMPNAFRRCNLATHAGLRGKSCLYRHMTDREVSVLPNYSGEDAHPDLVLVFRDGSYIARTRGDSSEDELFPGDEQILRAMLNSLKAHEKITERIIRELQTVSCVQMQLQFAKSVGLEWLQLIQQIMTRTLEDQQQYDLLAQQAISGPETPSWRQEALRAVQSLSKILKRAIRLIDARRRKVTDLVHPAVYSAAQLVTDVGVECVQSLDQATCDVLRVLMHMRPGDDVERFINEAEGRIQRRRYVCQTSRSVVFSSKSGGAASSSAPNMDGTQQAGRCVERPPRSFPRATSHKTTHQLKDTDLSRRNFSSRLEAPQYLESAHFDQAHLKTSHFEPTHFDPSHFDSTHFEPNHFDPNHFDSNHFESSHFEPAHFEPAHFEQPHFEPSHFEQPHFEPSHFEPPHFESAHFEPSYFDRQRLLRSDGVIQPSTQVLGRRTRFHLAASSRGGRANDMLSAGEARHFGGAKSVAGGLTPSSFGSNSQSDHDRFSSDEEDPRFASYRPPLMRSQTVSIRTRR